MDVLKSWRDGPRYWVLVGALVISIVSLISYEIWAQLSIFAALIDYRVQMIGVVRVKCSPEYFWGHVVTYKVLTDDYERTAHVCRDWKNERWVFVAKLDK